MRTPEQDAILHAIADLFPAEWHGRFNGGMLTVDHFDGGKPTHAVAAFFWDNGELCFSSTSRATNRRFYRSVPLEDPELAAWLSTALWECFGEYYPRPVGVSGGGS